MTVFRAKEMAGALFPSHDHASRSLHEQKEVLVPTQNTGHSPLHRWASTPAPARPCRSSPSAAAAPAAATSPARAPRQQTVSASPKPRAPPQTRHMPAGTSLTSARVCSARSLTQLGMTRSGRRGGPLPATRLTSAGSWWACWSRWGCTRRRIWTTGGAARAGRKWRGRCGRARCNTCR